MNGPDETIDQARTSRRPCLVDGCSCKDARIVSRRRAAYFAARARQTGQTADRVLPTEPDWLLPGSIRREAIVGKAAPAAHDWPDWRLTDVTMREGVKD